MLELPWLSEIKFDFPDVSTALTEPNGLLAAGGDLSVERLVKAYQHGIFPWYEQDEPILWWSPDPRAVIIPGDVKISRSLAKTLKKSDYQITIDCAFQEVIEYCAYTPRKYQPNVESWITPEMIQAYLRLYHAGYAHSVEIWEADKLIGGLYGVAMGRVFSGESMFSLKPDTSKIALVELSNQLKEWEFYFIDCQIPNSHLTSMGAIAISRERFLQRLKEGLENPFTGKWYKGKESFFG